jgi:polysaccharide export outer membrane protein
MNVFSKSVKFGGLLAVVLAVSACGLPRSGPTKNEVFKSSIKQEGNAYIIPVTEAVTSTVNVGSQTSFSPAFRGASAIDVDALRPGDRLIITVYENVEAGVLGTAGIPSVLSEVEVDQRGYVFVPYAGLVRASGRTTEAIRVRIADQLSTQTPDPQVSVARAVGNGSTVSVIGTNSQGVYPLDRSVTHLSGVLALAGGVSSDSGSTKVSVIRGNTKGTIWLDDLYSRPGQDIHLQNGDRVIVQKDSRTFSILGATGGQGLVDFPKPEIDVMEAIAYAGGLNVNIADPTGVFILRDEDSNISRALTGSPAGVTQRVAYVVDLTKPNGLFIARDFKIKDGDTVYVTEAPYAQFSRILSTLISPAASLAGVTNLTSSLSN